MKFVFGWMTVLSLTQVACAQPNYQDVQPLQTQAPKPAAAACPLYFKTEDLCASYAWVSQPTEDQTGSFTLKFWNPTTSQPADPKMSLKIIIWMPDMGHGSSPVTITKQATGEYLVDRVFFSMHGAWQIRFQMKNAQSVAEEQIADVNF